MSTWTKVGSYAAGMAPAIAMSNPVAGLALGLGGLAASLFGSGADEEERRRAQEKAQRDMDAKSMMAQLGGAMDETKSSNQFPLQQQNVNQERFDPFRDPEFLSRLTARLRGAGYGG